MARKSYTEIMEQLSEYTGSADNAVWTIQESPLGGRGLFASKPIKKGCLIFTNKPLVVGARADTSGNIHCSKCFKISDDCLRCVKCRLLLCSTSCMQSQEHSKECDYITTHLEAKNKDEDNSAILARVLIYFRFLLLPDEQKALMNVLQRSSAQCQLQELDALCSKYYISDEEKQNIEVIHSIMKVNSFRIANNSRTKRIAIRGLYPLSAFLNHSCSPNTRNIFMKDYTMAVYATKDIEVGDEIVSCYTGLLWCTPARRCQLYKTKSFWCNCKRCCDPSENGTKLSALKCLNTKCFGVILPTYPLNAKTSWCCDTCGNETSPERVNIVQSVLGSLVGTLHLDEEFKLENSILNRLASFVPYSNHVFVDIRLRLAFKLGNGTCLNGTIKDTLYLIMQANKTNVTTSHGLGIDFY